MNDNQEKAKQMFFDYACRHFGMMRDGVLKEYEKFGISKAQEREWRQEYISFWVSQLYADNVEAEAIKKLIVASAGEALPDLIKMAGRGDSYVKLWYAIGISNITSIGGFSSTLQEQAKKTIVVLCQPLVRGPIELSDDHKAAITPGMMRSLGASTPEEYIMNYANDILTKTR